MDRQQINTAIEAISAIGRIIRDAKRIPSGHLYAQLMNVLSLEKYESIIAILVKSQLIKVESHELIWIGE
jgi:hypothetical protein